MLGNCTYISSDIYTAVVYIYISYIYTKYNYWSTHVCIIVVSVSYSSIHFIYTAVCCTTACGIIAKSRSIFLFLLCFLFSLSSCFTYCIQLYRFNMVPWVIGEYAAWVKRALSSSKCRWTPCVCDIIHNILLLMHTHIYIYQYHTSRR